MTEPRQTEPAALPWRDDKGQPFFRHRPKLIGGEITLTLEANALVWSDGSTEIRLPLHQIDQVRLLFRPANLYAQRFRVEIRQRLGRTLWFSNISYRGLAEVIAEDAPFAAFVRLLLARIAEASPKARFVGGEPTWRYGIVFALSLVLGAGAAVLAVEALRTLSWGYAAAVVAVIGYMGWQMAQWLMRNRPVTVDPKAPPAALLPGPRHPGA